MHVCVVCAWIACVHVCMSVYECMCVVCMCVCVCVCACMHCVHV